jgi:hypothetical protein
MKLFGKFRTVFILLTCLSVFSPILAQNKKPRNTQTPVNKHRLAQKCNLSLAQFPAFRGIRLGMTPEQLRETIPGFEERYLELQEDENGSMSPGSFTDNGIGRNPEVFYSASFLDKRLTWLFVKYKNAPKDIGQDEFASKIAEALGVSANWFVPNSNGGRTMQCIGFKVVVSTFGSYYQPIITFQDTVAEKVLAKRKVEQSQKKRDSFKP